MRLICPNCGAQYEVDDNLVPDSGRDVQCSNCGHAWFQRPAHLDSELADELGLDFAAAEKPAAEVRNMPEPEGPDAAPAPPPPPRSQMDPAVREILRDEADREAKARRAEDTIETQADLGLTESGRKTTGARERMARLRGLDVDERAEGSAAVVAAATAGGTRRELLPDIEEINSSLRSAEEREQTVTDEPEPRRRGFRLGFGLVVVLVLIGVAVYVLSDRIAAAVPALQPYLDSYVAWIDGLRLWIDGLAQGWIQRLSVLAESLRRDT